MVCWLDQANTYVIVQHGLFRFSLKCYHTPSKWLLPCPTSTRAWLGSSGPNSDPLSPFPSRLASTRETPCQFSSLPRWHEDGVHPGGYHLQSHHQPCYSIMRSNHRCNLLQYVDDTSFRADGLAACQALLVCTEQWLWWSGKSQGDQVLEFGSGSLHLKGLPPTALSVPKLVTPPSSSGCTCVLSQHQGDQVCTVSKA